MATSPRLLLLVLLLFASAAAPSVAVRLVVGGSKRWAPNVNYTDWADGHEFHVGDWLEFDYEKDRHDVVQVNETAYATCDGSSPILSYSRGRNFVFRLNTTGRLYFICSRGYCWNGMKVSVLVQPAPRSGSGGGRLSLSWWARRCLYGCERQGASTGRSACAVPS